MANGKPNRTTWKWTPQKRKALLAFAEGKKWTTVLKEVGVSRSTLALWKQAPEFRAALDALEEEAIDEARRILRRNAVRAAQQVVDLSDSGYSQHAVRLAAAKEVLDRSGVVKPEIKPDGTSNAQPTVTIQINAIDYRAAVAAITTGPVDDRASSGEGESVIDGETVGEDGARRGYLLSDGESGR